MLPANLSSSDSKFTENLSEIPETLFHENLRTCTRQTPCCKQSCITFLFPADSNFVPCTMQNPCAKQTCFTCLSPTDSNHIRNLTTALNTTALHATIATQPAPPADHWISELTRVIHLVQQFGRTETPQQPLCPESVIRA